MACRCVVNLTMRETGCTRNSMPVDKVLSQLLSPRLTGLLLALLFVSPSPACTKELANELVGMQVCASKKSRPESKDCMVFAESTVRYEQPTATVNWEFLSRGDKQ